MIAFIFLLIIFLHGIVLTKYIAPKTKPIIIALGGFLVGSIFTVSLIYWTASLLKNLNIPLILFFVLSLISIFTLKKIYVRALFSLQKITFRQIFLFFLFFIFSYWLFSKSFGYNTIHGNFLVASNVYLDFGAHIPFIRSFSLGNNFPGEVPFLNNSGLLYYFLFDFYTGTVEHLGIRIDIAYNFLSSLSFAALLYIIFEFSKTLFKSTQVGFFSVIFFLFSSNLSFLTFFQTYGLHFSTLSHWWHNNFYFEGQPTIFNKIISVAGFWNLNPYMNQRHLVFGLAFLIFCLYILLCQKGKLPTKTYVFVGILLGFLTMWHTMIFIAACMIFGTMFLIYTQQRKSIFILLLIATCLAIPQLFLIKLHSANTIVLKPGFLLENMITVKNELLFWFVNLGVSLFTIPLGFFLAKKEEKKFFLIIIPLFLIPNLVHLSSRFTFDDHKYFNTWIVFANMFSALVIVKLFAKNTLFKLTAAVLALFLILSGLISIMVIKNDVFTTLPDFPKNAFLSWAKNTLPTNQNILTNGEIYDPITLIGKKTYTGRVQYVYVYGGDEGKRLNIAQSLLHPLSKEQITSLAKSNNISYIVLYKDNFAKNEKSYDRKSYDANFLKIYEDSNAVVYKI